MELSPTTPSPGSVTQCLVRSSVVREDPDYDIVRYRYRSTRIEIDEVMRIEVLPEDSRLRIEGELGAPRTRRAGREDECKGDRDGSRRRRPMRLDTVTALSAR